MVVSVAAAVVSVVDVAVAVVDVDEYASLMRLILVDIFLHADEVNTGETSYPFRQNSVVEAIPTSAALISKKSE